MRLSPRVSPWWAVSATLGLVGCSAARDPNAGGGGSEPSVAVSTSASAESASSQTAAATGSTGTDACGGPQIDEADECVPACPVTMPPEGQPCTVRGERCEYSDELVPNCRQRAYCDLIDCTWVHGTIDPGCQATMDGCPPTPDAGTCGTYQWCLYEAQQDVCKCGPDGMDCDLHDDWHEPPCPAAAPRFGSPCDVEGKTCGYGLDCSPDTSIRHCCGGVWGGEPIPLTPC